LTEPQKPVEMTADEIAGIFSTKFGVPKVRVTVFASPQIGWDVKIISDPRDAAKLDEQAQQYARALRPLYRLSLRSTPYGPGVHGRILDPRWTPRER
jgi:hypothetical protein